MALCPVTALRPASDDGDVTLSVLRQNRMIPSNSNGIVIDLLIKAALHTTKLNYKLFSLSFLNSFPRATPFSSAFSKHFSLWVTIKAGFPVRLKPQFGGI